MCIHGCAHDCMSSWDKFQEWNCWIIYKGCCYMTSFHLEKMVTIVSPTDSEEEWSASRSSDACWGWSDTDKFLLVLPLKARGQVQPLQSLLLCNAIFIQVLSPIWSTYIITSVNLEELIFYLLWGSDGNYFSTGCQREIFILKPNFICMGLNGIG